MYFDTAYLAKLYIMEHGSDEVRACAGNAEKIYCLAHGRVELAFTFHRKTREGAINHSQMVLLWKQVECDEAHGSLVWLPLNGEILDTSVKSALNLATNTYLRASDALHLVCAREHGFREIYSNDKHLLTAAVYFGVQGRNVIPN